VASEVAGLLFRAHRLASRRLADALKPLGLTPALASVLVRVGLADGTTSGEISAELGVTAPSVSQAVGALASMGYVERRPDPTDRRRTVPVLTEDGREAVGEVLAAKKQVFASPGSLRGPEIGRLVVCLRRLVEVLDSSETL